VEKELSKITFKDELYLASLQELLTQIWESDSESDLFIIGHNEGLSDLASYFSGENILLQTCGFIRLQFNAQTRKEWSKDLAQIIDSYRPEIIV
jgi:phosphohistidine phosphatase